MIATLQQLADREAIRELLAAYCVAMDTGDFAGLGALFAPDGVWQDKLGPAAIAAQVAAEVPTPSVGPRRIHFLSNIVIALDGDSATATSNWLVVRSSPAGAMLGAAGTYRDSLVRIGDAWRFARRAISEDIAGDLGLLR